jgi:tRNA 5-methylaminomethyl-2-thiouridine biosynthesis bifunctional protein
MKIAIIGAGMAGTACAYSLKQYGHECIVYDGSESIASKGSGNSLGLYNPRFAAEYSPEAEFYKAAFETAINTFPKLSGIDWRPTGALHLMTDETKTRRFTKMAKSWPWNDTMMQIVNPAAASKIAGIPINYDALYLPRSGAVSPKKLCAAYAQNTDIRFNTLIKSLNDLEADMVILACGKGIRDFTNLPVNAVRGQVTDVKATSASQNLKTTLCYSGYITPAQEGIHHTGSTFQRWLAHDDILPEDDRDNIDKFIAAVPSLAGEYEVTYRRAALRVTSPDHFPIIGQWDERIFVTTAHGSHGILSSLMGAHIIAAMITGSEQVVSKRVINRLDPHRFA